MNSVPSADCKWTKTHHAGRDQNDVFQRTQRSDFINIKWKFLAQAHTAAHGQSWAETQVRLWHPTRMPSRGLAMAFGPRLPLEWGLQSMEPTRLLLSSSFRRGPLASGNSLSYCWIRLVTPPDGPVKFPLGKVPTGGLVLQVHRQLTEPCIHMVLSKDLRNHWSYLGMHQG